jgi:regulator of RNase E activity RraA/CMP-N-acetylneuraminic acid synthetase
LFGAFSLALCADPGRQAVASGLLSHSRTCMETPMKVAAFLPAKGSSSRIPNKNMMLLDGEPLFLHTLTKLINIPAIDEVYLDTESAEIMAMADDVPCRMLQRPVDLASNQTDGNALFAWEVQHTDADICLQVIGTSPFLRRETIERAIAILRDDPAYDSVVAIRREKQYRWQDGKPAYDIQHIPNSVDLPETTIEAMSLYAVRRDTVLQTGRRIGDRPYVIELDPIEAIDVNWPKDFELAELIAAGLREQDGRLLANVRQLLSSALLSDILDGMGLDGVLSSGFSLNLPQAKLLGRAKTMQIDACPDDSQFQKIYDSLALYDHVVPNDIIVVANRVPEYAFFGELNANLALRAGAAGAIIDGVTRDTRETSDIQFPVLSKGRYCKDTRRRGIVTSKNRSVVIDGVTIRKNDLIFADRDGIVVIPRAVEHEVMERALKAMADERRILVDIAQGADTSTLVQRYGFF